ncbi:MAG: energy transducer TonB [Thiotrichales bacterium]
MSAILAHPHVRDADRFGLTLFVASVLHGIVILGLSFGFDLSRGKSLQSPLDVVLVNTVSHEAPTDAERIAQFNQQQSGSSDLDGRPAEELVSPMPSIQEGAADSPQEIRTQDVRKVRQEQFLTSERSTIRVATDRESEQDKPVEDLSEQEVIKRDVEIARLAAEVEIAHQNYAKRPRIHFIDALSAKSAVEAKYIDYWVKRVESIGNLNYPEDARRDSVSGKLILNVLLDNNGKVLKVQVAQSSGSKMLDEAAVSIVKISSPFPTFPREMRGQYDQLMITRTWVFHSGGT